MTLLLYLPTSNVVEVWFISIGKLDLRFEVEALVKYIKRQFVRSLLGAFPGIANASP